MADFSLETTLKLIGGVVTVTGGLIAAFKAIREMRRAREQRVEELKQRKRAIKVQEDEYRQKQAIFGRNVVREVFADVKARTAMKMLDWMKEDYTDDDGVTVYDIERREVQNAMRPYRRGDAKFSDKEAFIRVRFEALYDHLEQLEHLVGLKIVDFEDIETAFRYYMVRLLRPDIEHFPFFRYYDYPRAEKFVRRFEGRAPDGRSRM